MFSENAEAVSNAQTLIRNLPPTLNLSEEIEAEKAKATVEQKLKKRHGREYSLQLRATDKPINNVVVIQVVEEQIDGSQADETGTETETEVVPKRFSRSQHRQLQHASSPPHDPTLLSPLDARRIARQQHSQKQQSRSIPPAEQQQHHHYKSNPALSYISEQEFARRFGYSIQASPTLQREVTPFETPSPSTTVPKKRYFLSRKGNPITVNEDEEGALVLLPPPPLLRPYSFWRNTSRSALHTPSFHLIRRSTFIAAGLSFEEPFCDLSISAVEGRITIGKIKGLGGGAAIANDWDLFA